MIAVDLHLHTCHSYDCATSLNDVVTGAQRAGLDCLAVTDHNTIAGALKLRDAGEFRVIVGEEIGTADGEIIGLFISELVPPGLSALETIDRVKDQGGLVCIPHPFGRRYFSPSTELGANEDGRIRLSKAVRRTSRLLTEEVLERVDMLEAINSRTVFKSTWTAIGKLANLYGLPVSAGSDAHTVREIGRSRVLMPDFTDARSFLEALRKGQPSGIASSLFIHFGSIYARISRKPC